MGIKSISVKLVLWESKKDNNNRVFRQSASIQNIKFWNFKYLIEVAMKTAIIREVIFCVIRVGSKLFERTVDFGKKLL
jgi:hypothetical protein